MEEREAILRHWFSMWLEGKDQGIAALFQEDALYIESWGPQYQGVEKIKHWFTEWNTRGRVLRWDMGACFHRAQETMVTWRFHCRMDDGTEQAFEGVSYVLWSSEGRIQRLQEFGCNEKRYDPYEQGSAPVFQEQTILWF